MFCRRYKTAFPDMFDLSFQPRRMEDSFVPREFLALLNPWEDLQKCGGKICDRRSGKMRRNMVALSQKSSNERPTISVEPWQTSVPTEGFTPEDLMIYLQGRTVVVNGRQSQGDEETGIVSKEFKRRITLPSNFIIPSLDVGFEDGNVVLSGRRRVIQRKEEKPDKKTIADRSMTGKEDSNSTVNKNDECSDTRECEEPKNCENCDCSKSSSSEEVVMEDLGPEEEDGGRMEISAESCEKSESENDNEESETAKEVSKEKSEDTEEKRLEVSKTTSSEICEYKPMTWSIPFDGFDASDVKVHLEDDVVRVFAEHKEEKDGVTSFRRMERSFTLPESVDSNTLSSRFNTDDKRLRIEVMPNKKSSE